MKFESDSMNCCIILCNLYLSNKHFLGLSFSTIRGTEFGPRTQRSAFYLIWETHIRMDESLKKEKKGKKRKEKKKKEKNRKIAKGFQCIS